MLTNHSLALAWMGTAFCVLSPAAAQTLENWNHWRGPNQNGTTAVAANPPTKWSASENIAWITPLKGQGTSTPIVWENRIFLLSAEATDKPDTSPTQHDGTSKTTPPGVYYRFIVSCIDRNSGKTLWSKLAVEEVPHEGRHPTHTYAGSSPTTDGERLYVSFGSRGIFCYSLDGALLWKTDLGDMKTRHGWGESVTPVIHGDSLIINWDQEVGSFITCLDAATGQEKWKTVRPNEVTSWNTPLITELNGRSIVVTNGTHRVRAYDLSTGKELWSCGGQTVNAIPSPILYRDNVIVMSGYRGSLAVSIPLDSSGEITESDIPNWRIRQGTPYVPSPLLVANRLYFTGTNRNVLSIRDADSGKPLAEPMRLSALRNIYASPVANSKHIYFLDREGTCAVLTNSAKPEVVAINKIDDATDASPVMVGNQLFIRSWTKLYCITNSTAEQLGL